MMSVNGMTSIWAYASCMLCQCDGTFGLALYHLDTRIHKYVDNIHTYLLLVVLFLRCVITEGFNFI